MQKGDAILYTLKASGRAMKAGLEAFIV